MAVLADFECGFHGHFEARVKAGTVPKCPKGCSKSFVKLVFLKPVGHVSGRTRSADKLLREAAQMQGLSDISTSPSRPGGTVMERLRARHGVTYDPKQLCQTVDAKTFMGAMTHRANELTNVGLGNPYKPEEWKADEKTGVIRHTGAPPPKKPVPTGTQGVSVSKVKE